MQFIELFAGAGGMGLGLEVAGMEHLLSFEKEDAPHSVLLHAGKDAIQMDLSDVGNAVITMRQVPDLIVGGPPCQDFSVQGNQVEGDNARLTRHFAQIICLQRPEWFLFENVAKAANSHEYQVARSLWKRHGYGLTELMLNASEYGVPQMRERFFCIGRLHEIDGFLLADLIAAKSPRPTTVREILDPKRYPEDKELLEKGYYFVQPWRGREGEPNGRGVLSLDEPCFTISRHTRDKASSSYVPHPEDAGPVEGAPVLTSTQVARIQGFPADYDFLGKKYKYAREGWPAATVDLMIANAVPAPMAQKIGKVIFDRHHEKSIPELDAGYTKYLSTSRELDPLRKNPISQDAINNIRHNTKRALKRIGGRMYANLAVQIQALEQSVDGEGEFKFLKTRLQSDLRQCLTEYHSYRSQLEPSRWAPPPVKMPEFRERFRTAKKRRVKSKGAAIAPAALHPIVDRVNRSRLNLNAVANVNPELVDFFDDGYLEDHRAPQPPRGDPGELWRPDGYDSDYEDYLESLKGDD